MSFSDVSPIFSKIGDVLLLVWAFSLVVCLGKHPADPAYFQRHTVYSQIVRSREDVFAHTFAKSEQIGEQGSVTAFVDATLNSGLQTIGKHTEQLTFRIYAHIFRRQRESDNLDIAHTGQTMLIAKIWFLLYTLVIFPRFYHNLRQSCSWYLFNWQPTNIRVQPTWTTFLYVYAKCTTGYLLSGNNQTGFVG